MKAISILSVFVVFIIIFMSCEKPVRDNPWDEKANLNPDDWAPTSFQMEDVSITSKKLMWTYESDDRIEGFQIDRKKGNEEWEENYFIADKNIRAWTDQSIIPDTSQTYAYNLFTIAGENKSSVKTASFNVSFPSPSNIEIEKISDISYKLTWRDNSIGEQGFKIDRCINNGAWKIALGIVNANQTTFVDTNVFSIKTSIPVDYRVYAYYGTNETSKLSINTNASLTPPTDLQINVNSSTSVTLSWVHSATGTEGFKIDRKINDGNWVDEFATLNPTEKIFVDNTVNLSNYHYSYRVYAFVNFFNSPKSEAYISKPTIITNNIIAITGISACGGGDVTDIGGVPVILRGIVWNTLPNPTTEANSGMTSNGNGIGSFVSNISGLSENTFYYVRAYATNMAGTAYGDQVHFTTLVVQLPLVTTDNVVSITQTTVTLGGNVSSDGGGTVTARGFAYSTTSNPTITGNIVTAGSGTGYFTACVINLSPNSTYYVRAYATNSVGTNYGNEITFNILDDCSIPFTDNRDGNIYNTIQVGNQCWMKENLTWLPSVSPSNIGSQTSPYYYVYDYDGSNANAAKATNNYQIYGVLYNWPAALTACPEGWHLPTNSNWDILINSLGGSSLAGGKMKIPGITYWFEPNTGADNTSGFSGLPGGGRYASGEFSNYRAFGHWWSATEHSSEYANYKGLQYYDAAVYSGGQQSYKERGFSVRCLKN